MMRVFSHSPRTGRDAPPYLSRLNINGRDQYPCWSALFVTLCAFLFITGCNVKEPPEIRKPPAAEVMMKEDVSTSPIVKSAAEPSKSQTIHYVIGEPKNTYPLLKDIPLSSRLDKPAIRVQRGNNEIQLSIPLGTGEAIWGFGQRFDAFNLRGKRLETWTTDGWNALDTSYYAVPFFISSKGYGLFINGTGKLTYDIGANNANEITVSIPDTGADLYIFDGTPAEISRAYTELVGRPRYAPEWIFRPWISRNSYLGAYEVDYVVNRMNELGMPVGVVVLEAWEEQLHNFRFATHRYPDTQQWIRKLKDQGVHVVCWLTSSVWENTRAYNEAKENGWLVLNDDGSEHIVRWLENGRKIDFRKPGAFEWWRDLHKPLVELGVDGFKTDGGEHMPDPNFHNQHTYYYQKAALDAFDGSGREGITFARSASPLNAGLGAFWAGDQQAEWSRLRSVIRGGLSTSLSGFPLWTHDIGAYTGDPSKELYIRWLQLGVFSPIMQFHGVNAREPWNFDQETIDICRFYFQLREKLVPRIYSWGQQAITDGTPILRPLIWHFPEDTYVKSIDDQFMLGPDLMIAPVTDPINQRGIYLPVGEWKDLWNGETFTGPIHFLYDAPLTRIPVFVRSKKYDTYQFLTENTPLFNTGDITIQLAGTKNQHGIVPALRFWKSNQDPERIYYELKNLSDKEISLDIALPAPDGLHVKPSGLFTIQVPADSVQRLAFSVWPDRDAQPNTYPLRLQVRQNDTLIKTPPVGIVISPVWHVAGLFEGGVNSFQSLDGVRVDLGQTFTGKYATVFSWKPVPDDKIDQDGRVDLSDITGKDGSSTTFLYTQISVPKSGIYKLLTGFGDAVKIWVDGELVQNVNGHRNPLRDEDSVNIQLSSGAHNLLVRNSRDLSPPYFYFRIVD